MRDREPGDRDQHASPRARDQQQAHQEQQMVVAFEDVVDAELQIVACNRTETLLVGNRDRRLLG